VTDGVTVIAGLGNPGTEYAATRHNAGFWFLDAVLARAGADQKYESRFRAGVARGQIAGRPVWCLRPETWMNHSGEAVAAFLAYYRIEPEQLLVAHDELDLPPGTVRLKRGGGAGGHNGLSDIIARLGSREFVRLRIGIGHPGDSRQVSGYVLRRAPAAEQQLIETAIVDACAQVEEIVCGRYESVMNVLHSREAGNAKDT